MKKPGSIPVHCGFDKMVHTKELNPHPRNPNKHSDEQIKLLAKIIKYHGWRAPIVVSKATGFIVAGHARHLAAQLIGLSVVPVNFQDFKNEKDELAFLIADNRIAELAEMADADLAAILFEFGEGFDPELAGLDAALAESLATPPVLTPVEIQAPPKMAWVLIGVPINEFAKVQPLLDALPASAIIKTTANDDDGQN